jgi:hypothetical protein
MSEVRILSPRLSSKPDKDPGFRVPVPAGVPENRRSKIHPPMGYIEIATQVPVLSHSPVPGPLPSSHSASVLGGFEHSPVDGAHVPGRWHWSGSGQVSGFEPVQVPDWQVSVWVHRSPSLQVVPSAFAGVEHVPVPGAQVPGEWHWSLAVQTIGSPPTHAPD